ncbi:MAG: exopolysaccharide biosynthesis protein [Proteobacteria bacterium]|nr:exopolysaccharide biosynthesis protein [Pseudomonadota bacterium]MBW3617237.1 exopolysaccharide biosynthesis protein [Pseudomonadota bacterium]
MAPAQHWSAVLSSSDDQIRDDPNRSFIAVVNRLAAESGPDGLSIREVRDHMDERAFGLLILILTIPCLVPALYGVPQVLGIPILLLACQILIGRKEPWLPEGVLRRRVPKAWLDRMADFATKRMGWFERLSRPRLHWLAAGPGERLAALFMILATLTIVLPMTNTVPSVALALLSVGLIQRDGAFVALGSAVAAAWAGLLIGVGLAFYLGATWAVQLVERFTA